MVDRHNGQYTQWSIGMMVDRDDCLIAPSYIGGVTFGQKILIMYLGVSSEKKPRRFKDIHQIGEGGSI